MSLRVDRRFLVADGVVQLELVAPSGAALPPWEPGAHIEVTLPSGMVRHYSLCGSAADRGRYTVAVLGVLDGRGGSKEVHQSELVGMQIVVRGPRNQFPLVEAPSYLLLAGGIGITPLITMARDLASRGREWRCVYGGRSRGAMAFRSELVQLGGDRVTIVAQDERGLPDIGGALRGSPEATAVYCCGPERMIQRVERLCSGIEGISLHVERFESFGPVVEPRPGDTAFDVVLKGRCEIVRVAKDQTILDAVRRVIPNYPYSCLKGECGTCSTRVLGGEVDHRDVVLTDAEKAQNNIMMICVSRKQGSRPLILDL